MTPEQSVLNAIQDAFCDFVKPAAAIHRELTRDNYTLQIVWDDMQVFADVTTVVNEGLTTGRIHAAGFFKTIVDDLIHKFAIEIIKKREKMAKKLDKTEMRTSKVLRLAKPDQPAQG